MNNNFFITGNLHVGKSTLINWILDNCSFSDIAGFRTSRYYNNKKLEGFYIEDIRNKSENPKDKFIGRCINKDNWVSIPSTFDDYGVEILKGALEINPRLIVMDELGFFENEADEFQEMVLRVLDSEIPVLGVLKQKQTPFLDKIRNRDDVNLITISPDNRDEMCLVLAERIEKELCRQNPEPKPHIDVVEFERTTREVFAPVYPIIAKQMKDITQISNGLCLDIGAGTGHLGIELAKITNLQVILLDQSKDMLMMAGQNIKRDGLEDRVKTISGDVHHLPLSDQSVDLVISRGSLFFWEDKKKAFSEIYRVLMPDGAAFIGGGFGTEELKKKIDVEMQKRDKCWRRNMTQKVEKTKIDYHNFLGELDISNYQIINNTANMWVIIKKDTNEQVVTA